MGKIKQDTMGTDPRAQLKAKETVCAIVVTYNRKKLLLECLNAIKRQTSPVDAILLIDNASVDGTSEELFLNGYIDKLPSENCEQPFQRTSMITLCPSHTSESSNHYASLAYVRLPENTGGAGGFYEGVKRAYSEGFNWVWLMDDDAEPKNDALEKLMKDIHIEDAVALTSLKVNSKGNILYQHRGFFDFTRGVKILVPIRDEDLKENIVAIDHSSFVGILLSREGIEKAGFPNKDFFIHFDDMEYCIRLNKFGKMYLVKDSIIYHKDEGNRDAQMKKTFLGKTVSMPSSSFWISYYGRRNIIYLGKHYSEDKIKFYLALLLMCIKHMLEVLFFDDNKIARIRVIIIAYWDGLQGNMGKKMTKDRWDRWILRDQGKIIHKASMV